MFHETQSVKALAQLHIAVPPLPSLTACPISHVLTTEVCENSEMLIILFIYMYIGAQHHVVVLVHCVVVLNVVWWCLDCCYHISHSNN